MKDNKFTVLNGHSNERKAPMYMSKAANVAISQGIQIPKSIGNKKFIKGHEIVKARFIIDQFF